MPKFSAQRAPRKRGRAKNQGGGQGTPSGASGLTAGSEGVIVRRNPQYPLSGAVHRFVNTIPVQFITSSTVSTYGAYAATVAATGDFTSRAAVFDEYRIPRIDFFVKPMTQLPLAGVTGGISLLYFAADYDDDTAPSSPQTVLDYQNCVVMGGGQGCTFSIKPSTLADINGAAGVGTRKGQWIDCNAGSVKHYGVKWATTATSANQHTWILFARLHLEFRNPR